MCLASSPDVNQTVAPPPSAAPRAMASPYEDDTMAGNLSQLRMSTGRARKGAGKDHPGVATGGPGGPGSAASVTVTPGYGAPPEVPSEVSTGGSGLSIRRPGAGAR